MRHPLPNVLAGLCLLSLLGLAAAAGADTLPADPDAWSEYATHDEAEADGWSRDCGLSQEIVVSDDCCHGGFSVGCRTLVNFWCDNFSLERSVPLEGATHLCFAHKASWSERSFQVRVYMECTAQETAAGYDLKKIALPFATATEWTEYDAVLADGEWSWRNAESHMWSSSGGNTELTQLVSLEWFSCAYVSIMVGDQVLLDGLHFIVDDTPAARPSWSAVKRIYR